MSRSVIDDTQAARTEARLLKDGQVLLQTTSEQLLQDAGLLAEAMFPDEFEDGRPCVGMRIPFITWLDAPVFTPITLTRK